VRPVNQDAYAIHRGQKGTVAVVCDGVSTTPDAGLAAEAACRAAIKCLTDGLATAPADQLVAQAVAAAQDAVRTVEGSTTIVIGLVQDQDVVVANVGDSRAYWIGGDGDHLMLSTDDSGRPHEITAWLGPDGDPVRPHVRRHQPDRPGRLVLCSDGLWNYADDPPAVARILSDAGPGSPAEAARALLQSALDAGGADNVTVVVLDHRGGEDGNC
jgi:serine/threonine protein phosphatase PrpC